MSEFRWEQDAIGTRLVIWETTPPNDYAILLLAATDGWSVSLQHDGFPMQTITGLDTFAAAKQAAMRLQFQLALGDVDSSPPHRPPN